MSVWMLKQMISQAKQENPRKNIKYVKSDITDIKIKNKFYSFILYSANSPKTRQDIFNKIYKSLNWGGALMIFEKSERLMQDSRL